MRMVAPYIRLEDYHTAFDRGRLSDMMSLVSHDVTTYVEITEDGVLFTDNYFTRDHVIEVVAPTDMDMQFGSSDVYDILMRTGRRYGEQSLLMMKLEKRLHHGVVLEATDEDDPWVLGESFLQIIEQDSVTHVHQ